MKINMGTVEMTDQQRKELADVLDGKTSARKASRIEAKDFIWSHGNSWAETLADMVSGETTAEDPTEGEDDDDLIGDVTEDDIDEDDLL